MKCFSKTSALESENADVLQRLIHAGGDRKYRSNENLISKLKDLNQENQELETEWFPSRGIGSSRINRGIWRYN